jgi:cytochrome d ubiquinol oxidase subunit II
MMAFIASIGLPEIVGGVMLLALNTYVLTGGADFGGGVWDLLARGPRRDQQRALIADAIGPIWEANHVWLIIVVVMLFTAFPDVFSLLGTLLHIPIALMLVGIVLRGSAFVFRSYGSRDDATQRRWGRVFAASSLITPLLLGVIVGAIASGAVGHALENFVGATLGGGAGPLGAAATGAAGPVGSGGPGFTAIYVRPWLAPFPFAVGVLALALFAFLAAVYLTVATHDDALREDFRKRALIVAVAAFVAALGALLVARVHAPAVGHGLLETPTAMLLQAATATAALTAIGALWTRRWQLARAAAAAQVSLVLWGWVLVQYPYIIPPVATLRDAAAPRITLVLLLSALALGALVLIPSLAYLFRTFKAVQRSGLPDSDLRRSSAHPQLR